MANVDHSLLDRLQLDRKDYVEHYEQPVAGGGGPPHNGGMDQRIDHLERRMDRQEEKLDRISETLAEIKGKLSQMPTTFQIVTWYIGTAVGLSGLVFAIARLTTGS